jgi:hypothetical protein
VSDLRTVKDALAESAKPDVENLLSSIGAAGLVAWKILHPKDSWQMPTGGYEVLVLMAVAINVWVSAGRFIRAWKPRGMTRTALRLVDEMMVEKRIGPNAQMAPVTLLSPKKT